MKHEAKGQRKLAAIMFTDMVGYSALSQTNESLALSLLEEYRRILRQIFPKHNGKEIETAGDSFFVEFASTLDAARCAIQIQRTLFQRNATMSSTKHLRIRIGLHVGDVVHQGKHVHGDGVNIAARIEPCASPGGICLSEDVARQLQNKTEISVVKLGRGELKNIKLPVNIYRIVLPWERSRHGISDQLRFFLKKKRAVVFGLVALLAVVITLAILSPLRTSSADKGSIAVLPFDNLSGEAENEYFSDGITEDVIAQLSKIGRLKVISRTSVMQYKNAKKSLREIGEELHVATILEGSVRREKNHVRVVAQLLDARNDEHLWSETYDRELTQIFSIQTAIAKSIADALQTTISSNDSAQLEVAATDNVEAYDLYLQGRHHWNKRIPEELQASITLFERALDKDPMFALAYAGLADAYTLLGTFSVLSPVDAYPQAKSAVAKALEINPELADAHTALGFVLMHYDWDWSGAEKEFRRALELNPSSARAHGWYSLFLTVMGRFEEALKEGKLARELDPLSVVIKADAGLALYFMRKYDESIGLYRNIIKTDPTFAAAYIPLGGSYEQKSMYDSALAAFSTAGIFSKGHPIAVAALGHGYAVSGRLEDAHTMLELLRERSDSGIGESYWVGPYWVAAIYTALGDQEQAFTWLERGYQERDGAMVFIKVDPTLDPLRSDSRFSALLKKMRL
jgi:TolB-like protein/class 3 adenylate cyclase/Flp pilus assembly protein TadD